MRHLEVWDMPNFCCSPLVADVACFSCVDMYNKNVGICNAVCFEWMFGNLCVVCCVIGPVYDGLMSCVWCGCIIWVTWRSLQLQILGSV